MHLPQEKALELVSGAENTTEGDVQRLKEAQEKCELRMKTLKTDLYAKFGRSINLER